MPVLPPVGIDVPQIGAGFAEDFGAARSNFQVVYRAQSGTGLPFLLRWRWRRRGRRWRWVWLRRGLEEVIAQRDKHEGV